MRNELPACKIVCKQENVWDLETESLIVVLLVQLHFQLELGVLEEEKQVQREHANRCLSYRSVFFSP